MARSDFVIYTKPWANGTVSGYAALLTFWDWVAATMTRVEFNDWMAMTQSDRIIWVVACRGKEWAKNHQDCFVPDPARYVMGTMWSDAD